MDDEQHISFLVILSPPSMAVEALTLSPKPAEIKPLAYNSSSSIEPLGHNIWGINFGEDYFVTTVTSRASDVDRWIARTINVHRRRLHRLIVGIENDANKLYQDYGLNVARTMDVADMAAAKYDDEELKTFGLKRLVLKFLHVEMEKSKRITLSKWDVNNLSKQQIRYAAIDAFVSFKLAIELKKEIIALPKPTTFDAFCCFQISS
ncbi:hypothetical protein CICLE_v10007117mg [Citrus x clementina]|uniref:3'-5' exonuclease domain-containing protein n=1 Tax=Citrus clementina TaxID=85681 RepID=V4RIR6_CITCL|nr:hypothetical protein CICLE_v10007117mg [Citrus x clementina]